MVDPIKALDKKPNNKGWKEISNNLMVYDCGDFIAKLQLSNTKYLSDNKIDIFMLSIRKKSNSKFSSIGSFVITDLWGVVMDHMQINGCIIESRDGYVKIDSPICDQFLNKFELGDKAIEVLRNLGYIE